MPSTASLRVHQWVMAITVPVVVVVPEDAVDVVRQWRIRWYSSYPHDHDLVFDHCHFLGHHHHHRAQLNDCYQKSLPFVKSLTNLSIIILRRRRYKSYRMKNYSQSKLDRSNHHLYYCSYGGCPVLWKQ